MESLVREHQDLDEATVTEAIAADLQKQKVMLEELHILGHDDLGMRLLALALDLLFSDRLDFHRFDRYMTEAIRMYEEYEAIL